MVVGHRRCYWMSEAKAIMQHRIFPPTFSPPQSRIIFTPGHRRHLPTVEACAGHLNRTHFRNRRRFRHQACRVRIGANPTRHVRQRRHASRSKRCLPLSLQQVSYLRLCGKMPRSRRRRGARRILQRSFFVLHLLFHPSFLLFLFFIRVRVFRQILVRSGY